uniref:Uncharacterized protein n=1 Tax=Spironucleus salmonicida TaxID=348837 RepID=V6LSU7_9EUKA|eukprot:EST46766.1 Hypothetical protein SS50377_13228 [Spironucleus salmonicida]
MDILDVRNSTLNTIFIKLNQRANSGDILQKVAEKSHIKPYLTKSYPANACDLLIPVASLDSEVPRRFCSQNRKLVQNEAVYHITNNIYQIEENKITVKEKVQYYYVQLVNSNQLAKLVSLKGFLLINSDAIPNKGVRVQLQDSLPSPSITVPSQVVYKIAALLEQIQPSRCRGRPDPRAHAAAEGHADLAPALLGPAQPLRAGRGPHPAVQQLLHPALQQPGAGAGHDRQLEREVGQNRQISAELCNDAEGNEVAGQYCKLQAQHYQPCFCLNFKGKFPESEFQGVRTAKAQGEMTQIQFKAEADADAGYCMLKRRGVQDLIRINFE